jgi:transposase-like protein
MNPADPFKWRHFQAELILLCVRWYLRYSLSYRDLEQLMAKRGLQVDHTTIYRWVQCYAPELDRHIPPHLKATNDSWRVDEISSKVRGPWTYLYRAVDWAGNTLEFMLSPTRDAGAAACFLRRALDAGPSVMPRVINGDQNAAYPRAVARLLTAGILISTCQLRQTKSLNNLGEQDHRFIQRRVRPGTLLQTLTWCARVAL